MAIFTRRRIQAMLNDLRPLLDGNKRADLGARLNNKRVEQALPAEMELALVWAMKDFDCLEVEPDWCRICIGSEHIYSLSIGSATPRYHDVAFRASHLPDLVGLSFTPPDVKNGLTAANRFDSSEFDNVVPVQRIHAMRCRVVCSCSPVVTGDILSRAEGVYHGTCRAVSPISQSAGCHRP